MYTKLLTGTAAKSHAKVLTGPAAKLHTHTHKVLTDTAVYIST